MQNDFNNLEAQEQEFNKLLVRFTEEEKKEIENTYKFAKESHDGQQRDEGTPYVIHPLRIAISLITNAQIKDSDMIISALLHDVVEDTGVTIDDLAFKYNERVTKMVSQLTRERCQGETEKQKKTNKKSKIKWLMANGLEESRIIKCADIVDNMHTWKYIPTGHEDEKKFLRWMNEVGELYIPLAEITNDYYKQEMKRLFDEYKIDKRFI